MPRGHASCSGVLPSGPQCVLLAYSLFHFSDVRSGSAALRENTGKTKSVNIKVGKLQSPSFEKVQTRRHSLI